LPQALLQLHYGGGYTVDYSPSEFSFYKENGFDRIKAINFALIGEPGTPELPAVYLNYIIPPYAKVESLIVSQSNINQIYGAYLVYPAQPPRIIGESIPWVDPDSLIYNSDVLFPGEFVRIVSQGVMDGARIVTIEVRPLQYRPKSRRLYLVRNITIEFSLGPNLIDSYALWLYKDMAIGDAYTVFPPHFNGHHLFIEVNDAEQAVEYLSHGYAFNSIHCHGVREYFCDYPATTKIWAYWLGSPSPNNDGLNNLENFNKYIFVYSLACHNGGYDSHWINPGTPGEIAPTDTCIADGFTDTYNNSIGACSFLGYTRATRLSYSYDLEYEFYNCLFSPYTGPYPPEPAVTRLGVAEALSKCGGRIDWMDDSDRHNCYAHNHFGSPYTEAWTNQPGHFTVAHMRSIYVGVQYQFRVTVRDAQTGAYVAYAKVCLNKPDDIYEVGHTNENGQVDFFITAQSTGEIKVTVTRVHDNNTYIQYLPSETSCEVRGVAGGPQGSDMEQILPDKLSITGIPTFAKENLLLNFGVSNNDKVTISVYDAAGTKVRSLIKADIVPGYYQEKIDTRDLSSGVYFVVLKQDNRKVSRKFLLIK
jgi:hypothetical protein